MVGTGSFGAASTPTAAAPAIARVSKRTQHAMYLMAKHLESGLSSLVPGKGSSRPRMALVWRTGLIALGASSFRASTETRAAAPIQQSAGPAMPQVGFMHVGERRAVVRCSSGDQSCTGGPSSHDSVHHGCQRHHCVPAIAVVQATGAQNSGDRAGPTSLARQALSDNLLPFLSLCVLFRKVVQQQTGCQISVGVANQHYVTWLFERTFYWRPPHATMGVGEARDSAPTFLAYKA